MPSFGVAPARSLQQAIEMTSLVPSPPLVCRIPEFLKPAALAAAAVAVEDIALTAVALDATAFCEVHTLRMRRALLKFDN